MACAAVSEEAPEAELYLNLLTSHQLAMLIP